MNPYEDIINMPHHVSPVRPGMSMRDRAAQFAPFAALKGYDEAIEETARLADEKIELSETRSALPDGNEFSESSADGKVIKKCRVFKRETP